MTRRIFARCLLAICVVQAVPALTLVSAQGISQTDPQGTMLWISDIHFDPLNGHEATKLANKTVDAVFTAMKSGAVAPSGMSYLDQYFFDYSTRNGARNSKPRTHYQKALGSILGP